MSQLHELAEHGDSSFDAGERIGCCPSSAFMFVRDAGNVKNCN